MFKMKALIKFYNVYGCFYKFKLYSTNKNAISCEQNGQ